MNKQMEEQINFERLSEVIYWSKKWEISPYQLFSAFLHTRSSSLKTIVQYLRNNGFAL
jgi:hypothetical protein